MVGEQTLGLVSASEISRCDEKERCNVRSEPQSQVDTSLRDLPILRNRIDVTGGVAHPSAKQPGSSHLAQLSSSSRAHMLTRGCRSWLPPAQRFIHYTVDPFPNSHKSTKAPAVSQDHDI